MSSRSLAAVRARRTDNIPPPISGNRPITSIASQSAFQHPIYGMQPNVRTNVTMQPPRPPTQNNNHSYQKSVSQSSNNSNSNSNSTDILFQKLSVSDAIGLITLRLGKVEQWIIDKDANSNGTSTTMSSYDIPANHITIEQSVLSSIINRLDSLEKNKNTNDNTKIYDDIKTIYEQIKGVNNVLSLLNTEHTNNKVIIDNIRGELNNTSTSLQELIAKYTYFTDDIALQFNDYNNALVTIETQIGCQQHQEETFTQLTVENCNDIEGNKIKLIIAETNDNTIENINIDNNYDLKSAVETVFD